MNSNPDAKMPPAASTPTNDVKTDSIMVEFQTPRKSPFLWKNCENEEQRDRVDIKQQAVCDGLRLGETIINKLKAWRDEHQGIEVSELAGWAQDFDKLKKDYQAHQGPVVGFLGVIGAGKSSLVNALLDQEELLTSSSDRSATAVVSEVAYNHETSGYRAEIVYRTQQSLVDELDRLFNDLKWKAELTARKETLEENSDEGGSNDKETDELNELIAEIEVNISGTIETVTEVWGVDADVLMGLSTQELLESKSYGAEHLGTIRNISRTDQDDFSDEISSYLKAGSEDSDGQGLPPWPLIEKVTIYVKSPILRYGLRFRDLPGLCDTIEGRSNIARKNSKDLDITVIVAPAIRATEEATVNDLIKGQQKIEMQMDGKFKRGSFCVVLSKTDDIKSESYLKQLKAAKADEGIQNQLRRVKELDAVFGSAGSKKLRSRNKMPGQPSFASGTNTEIEENRREAAAIREWLEHTAISMRNRDITERMQEKFRKRHRDTGSTRNTELHGEAVEVFGISAKAYWMSKHPNGIKATGFPDENHSGIPHLRQWLFETTFTDRENQLDVTLRNLWALLIDIQDWAGWKSKDAEEAFEADTQELQKIHKFHLLKLTETLKYSGVGLSRIEPLREKEPALTECQRQCAGIVERWGYRYPKKMNNHQPINFHVQTCILRRHGEYYKSIRSRILPPYCWLDDLTEPFFGVISESWNQAFLEIVPAYEQKIIDLTEPAWQSYGAALARILLMSPGAKLEHITRIQHAIESGKSDLRNRARRVLRDLRTGSRDVHPVFRQQVKVAMIPVFQEASKMKGTGSKSARDKVLRHFVKDHSTGMLQKALEKMDAELSELFRRHVSEVEGLAVSTVSLVEKRVQSLFGARKAVASTSARDTTQQFLKQNDHVLASWRACWETPPKQREDHVMRGDMSIPDPEPIKPGDYTEAMSGVDTGDYSRNGVKSDEKTQETGGEITAMISLDGGFEQWDMR